MIDDTELARRSILGIGEMFAALGRWSGGPEAEVRWPNAVGARIDMTRFNAIFDSAVVPFDAVPPADDPRLPHHLWTVAEAVTGRIQATDATLPCMGIVLTDPTLKLDGSTPEIEEPSLEVLGVINERAYNEVGFSSLARTLQDDRIRLHGLREDGLFVCVALTLAVGEDISIQFVATEASHRRRGLASQLLRGILASARGAGKSSATLQTSPDGLPVYLRLGFHHVALLQGYIRPVGASA